MTDKLRLDIPILLPEVRDVADACLARLISEMRGREGIEQVHVVQASDGKPAQLCIHHDAEVLPLPRIRELVSAAGARIAERYGHAMWQLDIPHTRRARTVAKRLRTLPGVIEAETSAAGGIRAEFDRSVTSEAELRRELEKMRIGATAAARPRVGDHAGHDHPDGETRSVDEAEHDHEGGILGSEHRADLRARPAADYSAAGYLIDKFLAGSGLAAARLLSRCLFLRRILHTARGDRQSAPEALRDRYLDAGRRGRAPRRSGHGRKARSCSSCSASAMRSNTTPWAAPSARSRRWRNSRPGQPSSGATGDLREMPVEELAVGDVVVVKPDARLPADGFVVVRREQRQPGAGDRREHPRRQAGRRRRRGGPGGPGQARSPPIAFSRAPSMAAAPSRSRSPANPPTARLPRWFGW